MSNRLIRDDEDDVAPPPLAETAKTDVRRRRSQGGNGAYPGLKQVTAHIERPLFLHLKAISAKTDKPMVQLFQEALTDYVNRQTAQKKFGGA